MADHPSVPPGSLLGGKFRIERLLGAGAMGTVYAIDHELTRHKRALKLLHPAVQNIPDIVRRFLNEASAAGRAGNPHLVETFDAGTMPTGEPYVVMELLEGETLGAILRRMGTLDAPLAAELVAQAAEGIGAAHRAGIVHRDLKPENLFVTTRDGKPFIKIMDFGVSKFATGSSSGLLGTQAGTVYGSPAYMSPEQLGGMTAVDGRTDVFALGVVLFECLTGTLPFDGTTLETLHVKILNGDMPPIESLRPELPPGLVDVVRRALAADRDERIPTAGALAEALATFRALPSRPPAGFEAVDLGFAATIASGPPAMTLPPPSGRAGGLPSLPAGVPRPWRWLLPLLGMGALSVAMGVAIEAALLFARSRPPALAGNPVSPSGVPLSGKSASVLPASSTTAALATTAAPGEPTALHRVPEPPARPPKAAFAPAPSQAPSSSGRARSSTAQDLGLRTDNPFR